MFKLRKTKIAVVIFLIVFTFTSSLLGCTSLEKTDSGKSGDLSGKEPDAASKVVQKEPDEITVFMGNAGMAIPEGVDLKDNYFINKLQELANVKFKEITIPTYTDFATKFNMMIASSNIPDFVHCWFPGEIKKYGMAGAFLELTDIINNSKELSSNYTNELRNLLKSDDGKIYVLQSIRSMADEDLDIDTIAVRKDLLNELNNGIMPMTPEEWYEVFKKEKQKYPDSVPYTSFAGLITMRIFFNAYGVRIGETGAGWQYKDDKFMNALETPLCRESILFHKRLYEEGLLDREFITNKLQDFLDKKYNKKVIIHPNNMGSVAHFVIECVENDVTGAQIVPGPQPRVDDPRIKDEDVYFQIAPLGSHCYSIGANTKKKDAVVRLLETAMSDEYRTLMLYGREGIEHKVINEKIEVDVEKLQETRYRQLFSFSPIPASKSIKDMAATSGEDGLKTKFGLYLDKSILDNYYDEFKKFMDIGNAEAKKVPSVTAASLVKPSDDTLSKVTESNELSTSIILKAITGEISMEEYDAQVSEFLKKYQFITDEYNELLEKAKLVFDK